MFLTNNSSIGLFWIVNTRFRGYSACTIHSTSSSTVRRILAVFHTIPSTITRFRGTQPHTTHIQRITAVLTCFREVTHISNCFGILDAFSNVDGCFQVLLHVSASGHVFSLDNTHFRPFSRTTTRFCYHHALFNCFESILTDITISSNFQPPTTVIIHHQPLLPSVSSWPRHMDLSTSLANLTWLKTLQTGCQLLRQISCHL